MMAQTCSVHNGNSRTVGQDHNDRDEEYIKYHVNQEHVIREGYHRTIIHEPVEEAINRIFKDALDEYNEKKRADKKHPGREIKDYYKHLKQQADESKKQKGLKGNRKAGYEAMQPCYEIILQIGNCDTVNSRTNDFTDPERLDPELAEQMLIETVDKIKESFMVPAFDISGNPILNEDGEQEKRCCIEIIGLYIHDDERNKGVHLHMDYVPVAHNYKRGLSSQPGLTRAFEEMGLKADTVADISQARTHLMMEKYGIEYHDSDYYDKNGNAINTANLTDEQKTHRKLASELVPLRTPQMKFQDLCREKMREVMIAHNVPIKETENEKRDHKDHGEYTEYKAVTVETKKAKEQLIETKTEIEEAKEQLIEAQTEIEAAKSQLAETKAETEAAEAKKETLTVWNKKPKTEKELFDQIKAEVKDHIPLVGNVGKIVPLALWKNIEKLLKTVFRLEAENKELKQSVSYKKLQRADKVLADKDKIIAAAEQKAEDILAGAKKQATSLSQRLGNNQELIKLREELDIYRKAESKNPNFKAAVQQARQEGKVQTRVKNRIRDAI